MDDTESLLARLRFRHLQMLDALERTGSLRAASGTLNVTQPALSKALKELEEVLGFALFQRTRRGLRRTAQGAVLVHGARLLIEELKHVRVEAHAAGPSGSVGAVLRLGAPQFVAISLVPGVIKLLAAQAPRVMVTLREGSVLHLFDVLLAGEVDALLTIYTPESLAAAAGKAVRYEKIADEDYAVIAHPSHPLTREATVPWERLAQEPWILNFRPSFNRQLLEQCFLRAGTLPPVPVVESDSPVTNVRLAAEGLGLTVVTGRTMREAERAGGIRRVRATPPMTPTALGMVYLPSAEAHPRIASLRAALLSLGAGGAAA
ncbi:LysR family transcriptional regulator [Pigmentiphaga soli]|uniref:LysR family transcriptional regulator n=1 Tax=Pigmentiphaga soli TaxID=1007095 RepID=A0ABP8GQN7_9BURK